jgi:hypothetical protein
MATDPVTSKLVIIGSNPIESHWGLILQVKFPSFYKTLSATSHMFGGISKHTKSYF